jgi:methylenetetrahydrofolate reductase (NADPH)
MEVSLELVPRSPESLAADADICRAYQAITYVNVPDLTRFRIRSWEACTYIDTGSRPFIAHLRARDFPLDKPFPLISYFRKHAISKALVIAGDPPKGESADAKPISSSPTLALIRKLRKEMPDLEIYAAFDPYRENIRYELDYLAAKEDAGASAFMSQPFFDMRLLEIYAEYLEGKRIFWGIAPVMSTGNRNYWESRNRAIFPKSFKPDLFWNVGFGRRVIEFCERSDFNLYIMPIKMELKPYLSGLFDVK